MSTSLASQEARRLPRRSASTSSPFPSSLAYVFWPYFLFSPFTCKTLTILQPNGAEKAVNILADISDKEKLLLETAIKGLKGNIEKGITFAHTPQQK